MKGLSNYSKCTNFGPKILKNKKVMQSFQTMCRGTEIRHGFFYTFFMSLLYLLLGVVFEWTKLFLEANIVYCNNKPLLHQFSITIKFPRAQNEKLTMCRVTCVAWRAIWGFLFAIIKLWCSFLMVCVDCQCILNITFGWKWRFCG